MSSLAVEFVGLGDSAARANAMRSSSNPIAPQFSQSPAQIPAIAMRSELQGQVSLDIQWVSLLPGTVWVANRSSAVRKEVRLALRKGTKGFASF